jgi:hypothetical protein
MFPLPGRFLVRIGCGAFTINLTLAYLKYKEGLRVTGRVLRN